MAQSEEFRKYLESARKSYVERRHTMFGKIDPYQIPDSIPELNSVDSEDRSITINGLIRSGAIQRDNLKNQSMYWGRSRDTWWATWDEERDGGVFVFSAMTEDLSTEERTLPHFEDVGSEFSDGEYFIPISENVTMTNVDSFVNMSFNKNLTIGLSGSGRTIRATLYYKGDEVNHSDLTLPENNLGISASVSGSGTTKSLTITLYQNGQYEDSTTVDI